ncbi:serine hydrolase [Rhodococcus sp. KBS0724]|uniref:serine hydrolase n=1 Tax=Rhodococcus sp. KBS0724 TaxID=1179674 RepID=UPI00110D760E|nr:serine hydrolase [Rhodococcus sp. KBS0724]TSD49913.1 serine hydrolase [Rhodococcus sp. KBS0724]
MQRPARHFKPATRRYGSRTALAVITVLIAVTASMSCAHGSCAAAAKSSGSAIPEPLPTATAATPTVAELAAPDAEQQPSLASRMTLATEFAREQGAEVSIVIFDRVEGVRVTNGNDEPIDTASVSKLFIADDILFREQQGEFTLSEDEAALIDDMLRSSDDSAADLLWNRFGGNDIIDHITERYPLPSTSIGWNETWWETETTMSDMVSYYAALLDGSGGLQADQTAVVLSDIGDFTTTGADGYYQRFGIPDALTAESDIAVKQGWMCCIDDSWIHLSTGIAGDDHRYIIALGSRETAANYGGGDLGAEHARWTLTETATILFPDGRIDL